MILPTFWENPGQSICLRKWPHSIANHGYELAIFWEKSGPQEGAVNVSENGPFLFAAVAQNGPRRKCQIVLNFTKILGESWPIHLSPKMAPVDI